MTRKRVRMRRVRWLLTVLVGAVCAWNAGALIVQNAIHGWQQFPQLAAALAGAWIAAELANDLSPDGRRKPRW